MQLSPSSTRAPLGALCQCISRVAWFSSPATFTSPYRLALFLDTITPPLILFLLFASRIFGGPIPWYTYPLPLFFQRSCRSCSEVYCFGFLAEGLGVSFRRTYASGIKKFWLFYALFPHLFPSSPVPASAYQLIIFISWPVRFLLPVFLEVYLAADWSYHVDWGFSKTKCGKAFIR